MPNTIHGCTLKLGLGICLTILRLQLSGTGNVWLGHGPNQHARELSQGADSVGNAWDQPCDLQFQLVVIDAGGSDSLS